ncbi:NAD-dependent epimerase/dehydratase family protein [Kitasatospora sp. NPDC056731]|uniref:NAD-dependent epimerase/dehydratase family protein n=1 Tax=Kitasatospora sp. NPDC056731 TaxID=3155422 RepID=UPI003444D786
MRVLVTGGSGFLGLELCRRLAGRGEEVVSLNRRRSPELERLGVRQHLGDIADPSTVRRALAGCEAVIHNAALAGVRGPERPYRAVNVDGTRHVLTACRALGIRQLVYTSTASVAFTPEGVTGADESLPGPRHHSAAYPRTKAEAEAAVLAANGPDLATTVLRPHLIWGPGDPHFLPALLRATETGRLLMPGRGTNLVDTCHLATAAHAHLLALDRLSPGHPAAGQAYFIAQGEPRPLREVVARLLAAAGRHASWRPVPYPVALAAAVLADATTTVLRHHTHHGLSRFLLHQLTRPHWFDLTAARRDLGFEPPTTFDQAMAELTRHHRTTGG